MEQIYKSNLSQNLNHIDAVLFVYKKTIFDIHNGDESNKLTNIMTLNNSTISFDEREWRNNFLIISKLVNILFDWNNIYLDFHDRKDICDKYLGRFLLKFDYMDIAISYLEFMQQKIVLDYVKYERLIRAILEKNEKKRKPYQLSDKNEVFLIKFYVEEPIFREKLEGEDMNELINWLYTPV
jgi:hypothetical protein